jgi:hypothetical protein
MEFELRWYALAVGWLLFVLGIVRSGYALRARRRVDPVGTALLVGGTWFLGWGVVDNLAFVTIFGVALGLFLSFFSTWANVRMLGRRGDVPTNRSV